MKHQPFETWLFEQEALSPDQDIVLREHLTSCENCQRLATAWSEVAQILSTPMVMPVPGFTQRWRLRLVEYRQRKYQWQLGSHLVATTIGLTALTVLFGAELLVVLQPLMPTILVWLSKVANVLANLNLLRMVLSIVIEGLIESIPMIYRVVLPLVLAGLSMLWIVSLHRFSHQNIRNGGIE